MNSRVTLFLPIQLVPVEFGRVHIKEGVLKNDDQNAYIGRHCTRYMI